MIGKAVGAAGIIVALAATLVFAQNPDVLSPLKKAVNQVRGNAAWQQRAARPREPAPFSKLAASQVGYGPKMVKQFSSPKQFASFRIVNASGEIAFQGGAPTQEIPADTLGDIRTVWVGDFTPLQVPGRYYIATDDGLTSYPFDIGPHVFDPVVRAVQRAFYYQRAFTAIEAKYAQGPWVHGSDAALAPPGVVKGWHDAGDFTIYNASATTALFWMLSAAADFQPREDDTGIPESGNGVPDLLDEARWELEWMLSVQQPSGGFQNTTCLEDYGPYGTNWPERMPPYRAGEVGTIATGRAVGTLAFAAVVYRPYDAAFAERMLAAAQAGYRYLRDRPGEHSDGATCPNMRQNADFVAGRDVRMYAAAGLLLATGDVSLRTDFEENYQPIDNDPGFRRSNVFAAHLYLRASAADPVRQWTIRGDFRRQAAQVRRDGERHPFHWAGRTFWGSIAAGFHRTAGFNAVSCLEDPVKSKADCEQVLANVHHALGRNYQSMAYVSGLPGVTRGRTHGFHHWLASLGATPYLFPGLVAAGPNDEPHANDISIPHGLPLPAWGYWGDPAMPRDALTPFEGRYTDNDSWSTNELDVDWQGVSLYNFYLARWWANGAAPRR